MNNGGMMVRIPDPFGFHDWNSKEYVLQWAERQDEEDRREQFQLMADLIPFDRGAPITFLDLGAGYGALTQFLLKQFPNAKAVCHDGSEEMANLGRQRMARLKTRFTYVFSDFSKQGWSKVLRGQFDSVVSSSAIHNVRVPESIKEIYKEIYPLVRLGGCFLNLDKPVSSIGKQIQWLGTAGFKDAACHWKNTHLALFGGFRP